jgi:lipopolysaccharide/colanic/teichoic acid biosynthesis glycosyltransferase
MKVPIHEIDTHVPAIRNYAISAVGVLSEEQFRRLLSRERKRSERSRQPLLLMLVDEQVFARHTDNGSLLPQVGAVLCQTIRETDLAGWFETDSVLGVIFTELCASDIGTAVKVIESRFKAGLQKAFKAGQIEKLQFSFFAFPDGFESDGQKRSMKWPFYPDLCDEEKRKKLPLLTKRIMDVLGSACALILLTPIFLILATIIKLTSTGPVLFCQQRIGQFGVPFAFLKFRSMRVSSDAEIHKEYVRKFIAGKAGPTSNEANEKAVYKITNDPRVTWIGKIMRRTSLDELPQFWNVLKGDMSLVGPRPPVLYEIEAYDIWHQRRLLEAKPGITGLWQVYGRSKTTFDEMVRLDLQYARTWSFLLDMKILLLTPRAVFSGDGAY